MTPAVAMGISVSIATGLYGISFGALSVAAGLTFWQTVALSALMFTGGSQFAFVGVISGAGGEAHLVNTASTGALALSTATLLGLRNCIYGMQNNMRLRLRGWRKIAAAQLSIDEPSAVASAQKDPAEIRRGFWVTGIGVWILWNVFTILGALIGGVLGDPAAWGLDGAAVAAFCGLLWPRLQSRDTAALALLCSVVALISVPVVPSGIPILAAACAAGIWGYISQRTVVSQQMADVQRKETQSHEPMLTPEAALGAEGMPNSTSVGDA